MIMGECGRSAASLLRVPLPERYGTERWTRWRCGRERDLEDQLAEGAQYWHLIWQLQIAIAALEQFLLQLRDRSAIGGDALRRIHIFSPQRGAGCGKPVQPPEGRPEIRVVSAPLEKIDVAADFPRR